MIKELKQTRQFRRGIVHVRWLCVHASVFHDVWMQACRAEGRDGKVEPSPTGNVGRPQITYYNWVPSACHVSWLLSPCGALSPSLSLSLSLFLFLSIALFLALGIVVDYSPVPGLWLLRCGSGQIQAQTYRHVCAHTHTSTQKQWHTNTHGGEKFTRFSLIYLQHMFPICVKLLPECTITAEAFTSGEPNYLSDTTFPFSACPWHLVRLHFACTYRLKHKKTTQTYTNTQAHKHTNSISCMSSD